MQATIFVIRSFSSSKYLHKEIVTYFHEHPLFILIVFCDKRTKSIGYRLAMSPSSSVALLPQLKTVHPAFTSEGVLGITRITRVFGGSIWRKVQKLKNHNTIAYVRACAVCACVCKVRACRRACIRFACHCNTWSRRKKYSYCAGRKWKHFYL